MSWTLVSSRILYKYQATGCVWFHPICSRYAKLSLLVVAVASQLAYRHDGGARIDLGAPEETVKCPVSALMFSLRPPGSEASTSTEGLMSHRATRLLSSQSGCQENDSSV